MQKVAPKGVPKERESFENGSQLGTESVNARKSKKSSQNPRLTKSYLFYFIKSLLFLFFALVSLDLSLWLWLVL